MRKCLNSLGVLLLGQMNIIRHVLKKAGLGSEVRIRKMSEDREDLDLRNRANRPNPSLDHLQDRLHPQDH